MPRGRNTGLDPFMPRFAYGFRRAFAFFIDHYLIGSISYSIAAVLNWVDGYSFSGFLTVVSASSSDGVPGSVATWWLILGLGTTYFAVAEWRFGTTVGKLALGLRVVSSINTPLNIRQSLTRNLLKYVEFAVGLIFLIGFLIAIAVGGSSRAGPWSIFGAPPRQRWGDQLAGTYVIRGPWKPVRVGSSAPASSKRDSAGRQAGGAPGIRLSGRKTAK